MTSSKTPGSATQPLHHPEIIAPRARVRRKQNRDGVIEFAKELGWPNYKETRRCSNHSNHDRRDVELAETDDFSEENITRTIIFYANQTLRTIVLCYRDFASQPLPGIEASVVDEVCVFGVAVSNVGRPFCTLQSPYSCPTLTSC